MTEAISWLPALALFEEYGGDWNCYLDALYAFFKRDFIDSRPAYNGVTLGVCRT